MIIGIDTRAATKNKTGVGYLVSNLIPELIKLEEDILFKLLGEGLGVKGDNVRSVSLKGIIKKGFNFLWKSFYFPPANLLIGEVDKFFFTNFVDFPVRAKEKILLIPDLSYIKYPRYAEKKNKKFLENNVGKSIERANKIATISESAKKDIINYYNVDEKKVDVICLASSKNIEKKKNIKEIKEVLKKYKIKKEYILFVGTLEPRKNINVLIKAYASLGKELIDKYDLVICGAKGWHYDNIFKQVDNLNLTKRVIFTGYAEENDLPYIYSGASVFVFPSFYEGFGLPILEAMKCGVPVVSSNTSSLPEVGGDAALYFFPNDIEKLRDHMGEVLTNKELRESLIEKGHRREEIFSWENAAKKTLEIIIK